LFEGSLPKMIRRRDNNKIVITQTAHSWLAGQFAMQWGNDEFQFPALPSDMIFTAANHDLGWLRWEQTPEIDAEGRPIDFLEMPVATHLALWAEGITGAMMLNPYTGLLVSMHGRTLVEGRLKGDRQDTAADQVSLQAFVDQQRCWEAEQVAWLQTSPYFAAGCQPEALAANLRLLQVFDWLSLLLCMRPLTETTIDDIPAGSANERIAFTFKTLGDDTLTIQPWPFKTAAFAVMLQAHQLPTETYPSHQALQQAWSASKIELLTFHLRDQAA
jgi:hypothetical protein